MVLIISNINFIVVLFFKCCTPALIADPQIVAWLCYLFVKPYLKHNRTTGERYTVYKLVEGYRSQGQVTHRIIISFGRLDELGTEQEKKLLGKRVEELIINGGRTLATHDAGEQIEQLARYYFEEVCRKKRYDTVFCKAEWETVNMSTLKNKDARETEAEWLCKQAVDQLGIGNFLRQVGWEDDQADLVIAHIG